MIGVMKISQVSSELMKFKEVEAKQTSDAPSILNLCGSGLNTQQGLYVWKV